MLAEIGAFEGLIILAMLAVYIGTLVAAAKRGRFGWLVFILLVPGLATLAFWVVNPRPIDRGPNPA